MARRLSRLITVFTVITLLVNSLAVIPNRAEDTLASSATGLMLDLAVLPLTFAPNAGQAETIGDRLTTQTDYGTKPDPDYSDDQRITYTYLPTGWQSQRVIHKRTGVSTWLTQQTIDLAYYANGQAYSQTTKNASGTVLESHTLSYQYQNSQYYGNTWLYADGNRTSDAFWLTGPDSSAACYNAASSCTAGQTYDPRGRLLNANYTSGAGLTAIDYTLNTNGTIAQETSTPGAITRNFSYTSSNPTQLQSLTAAGTTQYYNYDPQGNLDCVASASTATCPTTPGGVGTNVIDDYTYDYLNRTTDFDHYPSQPGTPVNRASYSYDAGGRLSQETEMYTGGPNFSTGFSYEGLSDRVSTETQSGGTTAGTKTYNYDGAGQRMGLTQTTGGQTTRYGYSYDAHGSISLLINDAGSATAAYGYRPYGTADPNLTRGDTSSSQPTNRYRYMGKRFDPISSNLQMGARTFGPDAGQFLQPDRYQGALNDLGLSTDPLTQNRYSLAGGNPINFVEVDGHFALPLLTGLVGGVLGLGTDLAQQFFSDNRSLDQIDWGEAGRSAAVGAVGGFVAGATFGLGAAAFGSGLGGTVAAGALSGAASGQASRATNNALSGRSLTSGLGNASDIASDALVGGVTSAIGYGVGEALSGGCSFTPQTEVATANGEKPIGEIQVGDHVLAWNQATGATGTYTVTAVLVHADPTIVHLNIGGEPITTTPEHPFYTIEHGWTPAGHLHSGEHVRKADGRTGEVQAIQVERHPQVMYNLTVATAHTFFVGDGQWLVHNQCRGEIAQRNAEALLRDKAGDRQTVATVADTDPSGYGYPRVHSGNYSMPGFTNATALSDQLAKEMGFKFANPSYGTHAEPQLAAMMHYGKTPKDVIGVSNVMCDECKRFFDALGRYTGSVWEAYDTTGPLTFPR